MTEPRPSTGAAELAPGTRVGHYCIVETIGQGGEARVYRARDLTLDRDVALKSPLGDKATTKDHTHLLKEARAASRLSHPGIVPLHEIFEDNGRPWIAMGLVEGTSLRAVLSQRGSMPVEDVARYGEMLADALHAAHEKHVLHRDVTPGNILLTSGGRLLLTDFGLAHSLEPPGASATDAVTTSLSQGHIVGTLGYMSPEQMLGRVVGPQSDIFSVGAVLYQMATGTRAFPGTAFGEVLDATLHREPAPLSKYTDAPPELDRIVRKALAKRLDERYASAADLLADLRVLRRKLESSQTVLPVPGPRPWLRRGTVALAGLVVVAAVAAGWTWRTLRLPDLPQATPHQITAGSGWEAEARISPDGSDIVYTAEAADGNSDLWLVDARGGSPIPLTDHPASDRSPAWFPDGSAIAFVSERGGTPDVWKVSRLGGSATMVVGLAESPAISPDGTQIAFTRSGADGNRRILVAPLAAPADARVLTTDKDGLWDHRSPAWSPDGRTICYAGQRDLWIVGLSGQPASRLTMDDERDLEPAWSPDGRFVYFSSFRQGTIALWRVPSTGGTPTRVTLGAGPERQPSLSRDGTRLVYSTFLANDNLVIRNQITGAEIEVGGQRMEVSPAFAPDGRALVYSSNQFDGRFDLWIQPLTGEGRPHGAARRVTDHPGSVTHPSFSLDGKWIAYQRALDRQRDIWIAPVSGGTPTRFTDDPAADILPEWSPDGRQIAFVSERSGTLQVWLEPVANGRPAGPATRLTSGELSQDAPVWAPDSRSIAFVVDGAHGAREVWVVDARATTPARQVTRGAKADRTVWTSMSRLLVSGRWGSGRLQLMGVDVMTGTATPAGPPGLFGYSGQQRGEFAVTRDGRLLAAVRQVARGDVWMLEAVRGTY